MPDLTLRSPDNPEFARVLETARLRDTDSFAFDISPTDAERAALARLLGARSVRKLRFAGTLAAAARGAFTLGARLEATVIQTCVVSLEPVTSRVEQDVTRRFEPQAGRVEAEVTLSPHDDDEIEPLGDRIDLGLVAIEALALALPAYPRRDGATLARTSPGDPEADREARPFAALAALRDKLGGAS